MNEIELSYINKQPMKENKKFSFKNTIQFPKEFLEKQWATYDWKAAELYVGQLQRTLAMIAYSRDLEKLDKVQRKLVSSFEARMLAVKRISENASSAGIDNVKWRTDYDKMCAVNQLDIRNYEAKPLRYFILKDKKSNKERCVGVPTLKDRAMHYLWSLALEPVAESWADYKSFGFRKGRGTSNAHAHLMNALNDPESGSWILVADVFSYYESISHKWLLDNIPMDKSILKQFLKAGIVLPNGELFPVEEGISLGCSLSPILGNMTLDGIQKELYDLQGESIREYKNGWCIRFADDMVILANSKVDAEKFRSVISNFLEARGLKLSPEKTKIVNLNSGDEFTFLARTYYKRDGIVHCKPSQKSRDRFRKGLDELLFNPNKKWTQKSIITEVNQKINGWASYHRIEEAKDAFNELDSFVSAEILRLVMKMYPNLTKREIRDKFYWQASDGKYIFSLNSNRDCKIINMFDIPLIRGREIDVGKNYFTKKKYFEMLSEKVEIENATGKYKELWKRQNGTCAICSRKIQDYQGRKVIFRKHSKDKTINNMVYIHKLCEESELAYVYGNLGDLNVQTTMEVIQEIQEIADGNKKVDKSSKFDKLKVYFQNEKKKKITLTYLGIERILGSKLCSSAYKSKAYFYNNGNIAKSWTSANYQITNFDFENQKITFEKTKRQKSIVPIPKFMFDPLPKQAVAELEEFYRNFTIKYKLRL